MWVTVVEENKLATVGGGGWGGEKLAGQPEGEVPDLLLRRAE